MKRKSRSKSGSVLHGDDRSNEINHGLTIKLTGKRLREDDLTNSADDAPSPPKIIVSKLQAPKYGSKEYWEARYKSHLPGIDLVGVSSENSKAIGAVPENKDDAENTNSRQDESLSENYVLDGVVLSKEATKPGHEWYFSYDELRPLILPLILGSVRNEVIEGEIEDGESGEWAQVEEEGVDENEAEKCCGEHNGEEGQSKNVKEVSNLYNRNQELKLSTENSNEDSQYTVFFSSGGIDTTNHRPIRVLEVGCGDVPLGTSLASEISSMQSDIGFRAPHIVEEVTCIDYSEVLVLKLIQKQKSEREQSQSGTKHFKQRQPSQSLDKLQPTFRALDARSLPFSANTYDLILEKGTLDAMLSDDQDGLSNCIQIVKEMARVTSEGGVIFIVSHLNANDSKGMSWLEDVVFRGLKEEFHERQQLMKEEDRRKAKKDEEASGQEKEESKEREFVWSVEVHGGEGKFLDANGDEIDGTSGSNVAAPIYGPAVYIIRKKGVPASIARELFGKKKRGMASVQEEVKISKKEQNDHDLEDSDKEPCVMEMPPVKLEFLTY